ncbi:MAG TPA: hypothetical protein VIT44_16280 [Cyclobacteriaceae bacterium]
MKVFLLSIASLFITEYSLGQVYSNKIVGKKNASLSDSLKAAEYPYMLPIWGEKVAKRGFDLPYSAGINVNYLYQQSDLVINNLEVGFNNGPLYNLDEVVRFNKATSTTNAVNFRPDVWILPFLNVYGIFAKSRSSTAIDFGVWAPNSSNEWTELFKTTTKAEFEGSTVGFGLTPTIGVGGGFMALDMNMAWTDIDALEKPAFSFVFGPRLGKSFRLKNQQALTIWVGGFRVKINSETKGSLSIGDLFDSQNLESQIEEGLTKVGDVQQEVDAWWSGLSATEQKNPANKSKYATANRALEAAGNFLNTASGAVSTIEQSTVQYSLDKQQKSLWNFIVGGQYQLNKHFMIRGEVGFLGTRTQTITGVQYRFGL